MGITDKLEKMMEHIMDKIGGVFSGGKIHPVEIARKAVMELKRNQKVSVSQTYIPNIYEIILNPDDQKELLIYEEAIIPEIKEYIMDYIKKEDLSLIGELVIELQSDETMEQGKFEVKSQVKKGKLTEPELEKTAVRKMPVLSSIWAEIKEGPEKGKPFPLIEGVNIIGRKEEHQIKISGSDISRTHGAIHIEGTTVMIEDLGSTNGTYVNGKIIKEKTQLKKGDFISLGDTVIEIKS
ncbi:MAG: DUF3662 and FHA domain-containing protein [Candidatus Eremiobacterota bacterium]